MVFTSEPPKSHLSAVMSMTRWQTAPWPHARARNVRRDAMKAVDAQEKKGDLGEDEAKALADTVQELTDEYVKQVRVGFRVKVGKPYPHSIWRGDACALRMSHKIMSDKCASWGGAAAHQDLHQPP